MGVIRAVAADAVAAAARELRLRRRHRRHCPSGRWSQQKASLSALEPFGVRRFCFRPRSPVSVLRWCLEAGAGGADDGLGRLRGALAARHGRHARSHSHHGHRAATVTSTPQAVRHVTVVSRRRRSHATAASSDFFCVPFGGAPIGASRHLRLALCDDGARRPAPSDYAKSQNGTGMGILYACQ